MFKFLKRDRTPVEKLTNVPLIMEVGGYSGKDTIRRVELREPNLEALGKHLSMIAAGVSSFLTSNQGLLGKLMNDPKSIDRADIIDFGVVPDAAIEVLADLVGESPEWIKSEMRGQETVVLMEAYLELIGWDLITKTFIHAWQSWNTAMQQASAVKKAPTPPWSVRPSSQSAPS